LWKYIHTFSIATTVESNNTAFGVVGVLKTREAKQLKHILQIVVFREAI